VLEAIYGAYAIDWLDQHERIRESIAAEARWLAVLTASLLERRRSGSFLTSLGSVLLTRVQRLFALKRELVVLRKVVTPQRDLLARSIDLLTELPGLVADERDYFRNVYDHLIRISDLIDEKRMVARGTHCATYRSRTRSRFETQRCACPG